MIRRATTADVPALHALVEGAYRGDSARGGWTHEADLLGGQRTDAAALATMIDDPAQVMLVAEDADGPTGCIALRWLGDGAAYVGMVTVAPAGQGRGLGRVLLAAAEDAARDAGCTRAEMTVIAQRGELIAWYERRGYALTAERRPFPMDDPRFGVPKRRDLAFAVLEKPL